MLVTLTKHSAMDCKEVNTPSSTAMLGKFQPRRYSKKQRLVNISMVEVHTDAGVVVDSGFLSLDTRTGKLCIERCSQDIPFDIEKPPEAPKDVKGGKHA